MKVNLKIKKWWKRNLDEIKNHLILKLNRINLRNKINKLFEDIIKLLKEIDYYIYLK